VSYPSDHSPNYLQQRLEQISDPGSMKDMVAMVTTEHGSLEDRLLQGKQRYDSLLADRKEFDKDLNTLNSSLRDQVDSLGENCLTEDWRVESADAVLHALQVSCLYCR